MNVSILDETSSKEHVCFYINFHATVIHLDDAKLIINAEKGVERGTYLP